MMTGYQKKKLDELIDILNPNDVYYLEPVLVDRALSLAKAIRDFICDSEPVEEDKSESNIMDAYFQYEKEEGK